MIICISGLAEDGFLTFNLRATAHSPDLVPLSVPQALSRFLGLTESCSLFQERNHLQARVYCSFCPVVLWVICPATRFPVHSGLIQSILSLLFSPPALAPETLTCLLPLSPWRISIPFPPLSASPCLDSDPGGHSSIFYYQYFFIYSFIHLLSHCGRWEAQTLLVIDAVCMLSHFSHVQLLTTLWTVACQAPLSMGILQARIWSGLPCLLPGDLLDPGIEPVSPASLALAGAFFTTAPSGKPQRCHSLSLYSFAHLPSQSLKNQGTHFSASLAASWLIDTNMTNKIKTEVHWELLGKVFLPNERRKLGRIILSYHPGPCSASCSWA